MDVQISYLFSRRPKFLSKVIALGAKYSISELRHSSKIPSHTAYLINNRYVVESVFEGGYRVLSYNKWKEINELIAVVPAGTRTMTYLKEKTRKFEGRSYDMWGALYLAMCVALKIFFRIPIPKHNRLHKPHQYFCCELIGELEGKDYAMKSPAKVMLHVQKKYTTV